MPIVTKHFAYTDESVRKKGRSDGQHWKWRFWPFLKSTKQPFPNAGAGVIAPYWTELRASAEAAMAVLAAEWKQEDVELSATCAQAAAAWRHATETARKEGVQGEAASGEFDTVRTEYLGIEQPTTAHVPALILLLVFGVSEGVFNGVVFRLFGERQAFTWLFALGLGALLPYLGHTIGHLLKQRRRRPMDWVMVSVMVVLAVLALLGVSNVRGTFLETSATRRLLGYSMTVETARSVFFVFNLVLFVGASVVGYMSSHADATKHKTVGRQYRHARAKLDKEGGEAEAAVAQLAAADTALAVARRRRATRFEFYKGTAEFLVERNETLANIYRAENLTARGNSVVMDCFPEEVPPAELPKVFKEDLFWPNEPTETAPLAPAAAATPAAAPPLPTDPIGDPS